MIYVMAMGLVKMIGVENIPVVLVIGSIGIVAALIGIRKEDKHESNSKARKASGRSRANKSVSRYTA